MKHFRKLLAGLLSLAVVLSCVAAPVILTGAAEETGAIPTLPETEDKVLAYVNFANEEHLGVKSISDSITIEDGIATFKNQGGVTFDSGILSQITNENLIVEFVVKPSVLSNNRLFFSIGDTSTKRSYVVIGMRDADGKLKYDDSASPSNSIKVGGWYNLKFVIYEETVEMYVNGYQVFDGVAYTDIHDLSGAVRFGEYTITSWKDAGFEGQVSEIRISTGNRAIVNDSDPAYLDYVQEGLVSLYSGYYNTRDGHSASSTVWYDLVGQNNVNVAINDKNYFTGDAYHLERTEYYFPSPLMALLNSDEFTVEMTVGDFQTLGTAFATMLNSANDNFALFWRADGDFIEFKSSSNARPKVGGGAAYFRNSTVAVTFKKGGKINMYVDGILIGSADATVSVGGTGTLKFGHSESSKVHIADYKGFRFYDRVLSADEIVANAQVDQNYDANQPTPKDFVQVAQPSTGIVGDITFSEYVTNAATLEALMKSEAIPANMIFYVNAQLQVVDAKGENAFMKVEEIFSALENKVIPTFYVKDTETVDALCEYLSANLWEDLYIMSSDPALVKRAREKDTVIRGIIDFSEKYTSELTEEQLIDIRKTVNSNLSKVVVLSWNAVTADNVDWLNDRAMTAWVSMDEVTDTVEAISGLLSGAYGIVSSSTAFLYDTCKTYVPEGTITRMPVNIGHRGLFSNTDYPENTLEAMIAAYEAGAEMLEMDIYLTLDGELAINHNATTGAIYDQNWTVEQRTMEELKTLNANKNGKSYKMPSLREVFEYFKDKDVRFMVEIKSSNKAIVQVLKDLIEEYDNYARCTLITFAATNQFENLKEVYPEMPVGYLTDSKQSGSTTEQSIQVIQRIVQGYNTTYSPNYNNHNYDAAYVNAALKRGITTWVWTLSDEAAIYPGILNGKSGITGNRCDILGNLAQSQTTTATDGLEIPTGEAYSLPVTAVYYNGSTISVGSSATLKLISGTATIEGNTITIDEAGAEATVVPFYTVRLGNYGSYTLAMAPITLKAADTASQPGEDDDSNDSAEPEIPTLDETEDEELFYTDFTDTSDLTILGNPAFSDAGIILDGETYIDLGVDFLKGRKNVTIEFVIQPSRIGNHWAFAGIGTNDQNNATTNWIVMGMRDDAAVKFGMRTNDIEIGAGDSGKTNGGVIAVGTWSIVKYEFTPETVTVSVDGVVLKTWDVTNQKTIGEIAEVEGSRFLFGKETKWGDPGFQGTVSELRVTTTDAEKSEEPGDNSGDHSNDDKKPGDSDSDNVTPGDGKEDPSKTGDVAMPIAVMALLAVAALGVITALKAKFRREEMR